MVSLRNLFRPAADPYAARRPLWQAVVRVARAPHWYETGAVADTIDGRFEMIALILSLVLHRIDASGQHAREGVELTELFVADMDGQMRQIGFGDMVVGKQIGKMVSALGGRLGAYRAPDGIAELHDALVRNLWRGEPPGDAAAEHVLAQVAAFRAALAMIPVADLVAARVLPDTGP